MAAHANEMALILREGIMECGYPFYSESVSNQQFPIFPDKIIARLRQDFQFQDQARIDIGHTAVRLVTSWATTEAAVKAFVAVLKDITSKEN